MTAIQSFPKEALDILLGQGSLNDFGKLLNESWHVKRSLSKKISSEKLDLAYSIAIQNGALGGKLLGAGGGGFFLFFAPPEKHKTIEKCLPNYTRVKFEPESKGSQIVLSENAN